MAGLGQGLLLQQHEHSTGILLEHPQQPWRGAVHARPGMGDLRRVEARGAAAIAANSVQRLAADELHCHAYDAAARCW